MVQLLTIGDNDNVLKIRSNVKVKMFIIDWI